MTLQHYNVALHCWKQNIFSLHRINYNASNSSGAAGRKPLVYKQCRRDPTKLLVNSFKTELMQGSHYCTHKWDFMFPTVRMSSSTALHSLKNLSQSPNWDIQIATPSTNKSPYSPLQYVKRASLHKYWLSRYAVPSPGTNAAVKHAITYFLHLNGDSGVPLKIWYISTRTHCQLRTQHRTSNPYKPHISIDVPSSCPTIILHIIILKPLHYDATGFKIYFIPSKSGNASYHSVQNLVFQVSIQKYKELYGCEEGT
jgi:hypothetical protein